ncbi:MAG: histidine kinase N-terminal 7TM domain-containing protein [Chloroflexota bacterium]
MDTQTLPYVIPLLVTTLATTILAIAAWRRRPAPGTMPFALFLGAISIWSCGYAFELLSVELTTKTLLAKLQYVGIVAIPVLWLVFVVQYTQRNHWLSRRNLILLTLLPCCTFLLVWTNEVHGLIWQTIKLVPTGLLVAFTPNYGPWFWVHTVYSYLLFGLGFGFLVQFFVRSPRLYRSQVGALLVGAFLPWTGNVLYVFGLNPLPGLDLTPFGFALSGLAITWGLFRLRLLDIVPLAYDSVIESMLDGIIIVDAQRRIVNINPMALELLNYKINEVIGQPVARILDPALVQVADDSKPQTVEITRNQTTQILDVRRSKITHSHRVELGVVIVLRDITEQRHTELALQQAKEAAESASRAKGIFLANMSHELRTPLTAIIGYGELLSRDTQITDSPIMTNDLQAIQIAGRHLLGLINNVLDLSKIEAGRVELYEELINIPALIDDVAMTVRPLVENNHSTFEIDNRDELGIIRTDITKLRQILFNLLSNAAKFTEHGTITLTIDREVLNAEEWVSFQIADSGVGIPVEHMNRLFKDFMQGDEQVARTYGGTGLGLTISHRFCQLMGGTITATSAEGEGSVFTVSLPAKIGDSSSDYTAFQITNDIS